MSRRPLVRMTFRDSGKTLKSLATPAGLEPATCRLEGCWLDAEHDEAREIADQPDRGGVEAGNLAAV
jgi:hypothetical protein